MKKRLVCLLLISCTAFSLFTGCGEDNGGSSRRNKEKTEKTEETDNDDRDNEYGKEDNKEDNDSSSSDLTSVENLDFDVEAEGICGYDLNWKYGEGILVIYGSGDMMETSPYEYPWADYKGVIQRVYIDGATNISYKAFYYCTALSYVEMTDSVEVIDYGAFLGCNGLVEVRFSNNLRELGENAFDKCEHLHELDLYNTKIKTIYYNTFSSSVDVKIVLPQSLVEIAAGAFGTGECRSETATSKVPGAKYYLVEREEIVNVLWGENIEVVWNGFTYTDNESLVRALDKDGIKRYSKSENPDALLVYKYQKWVCADDYTSDMGPILDEKVE